MSPIRRFRKPNKAVFVLECVWDFIILQNLQPIKFFNCWSWSLAPLEWSFLQPGRRCTIIIIIGIVGTSLITRASEPSNTGHGMLLLRMNLVIGTKKTLQYTSSPSLDISLEKVFRTSYKNVTHVTLILCKRQKKTHWNSKRHLEKVKDISYVFVCLLVKVSYMIWMHCLLIFMIVLGYVLWYISVSYECLRICLLPCLTTQKVVFYIMICLTT